MTIPILIVSFMLEHLILVVSKWIDLAALTFTIYCYLLQHNQRDRLSIPKVAVSQSVFSLHRTFMIFRFIIQT